MELNTPEVTDFHDAMRIAPARIKDWHKIIIQHFKDNPKDNFYSTRSGNSLVFGRNTEHRIEIYEVTSGYKYYNYEKK